MPSSDPDRRAHAEAAWALGYFALYLGYLFLHPEGELLHWVSLVAVPCAGLWWLQGRPSPASVLRSLGLDPARAARGLPTALVLGLAIQGLQLLNRNSRVELARVLESPWGWLAPIAGLALLIVTVGFTEEVFFRGILQRRLADALGSRWAGLFLATVAFVIYHVPYAYLVPAWPSAGDLGEAARLAAVNGVFGGLVLGWVYLRSGYNLFATILLHAMIDWVPGTLLVARWL